MEPRPGSLWLAFQNDHGHRVLIGVAQRDQRILNSTLLNELLCAAGQNEIRFAACFFSHVNVAPPHRFADSGAESL